MTKQFTKLTDSQWTAIWDIFTKRKRTLCLRAVVNALLYMVRVGCQWRNLPEEYPKWRAVNYYFKCWKVDGTFEKINVRLNELDRQKELRTSTPSLVCVDSQSVKLNPMIEKDRGIDENKCVNGRKREYLVDTGGRLWVAVVHAANIADGKGALPLLDKLDSIIDRLEKFLGDTSYNKIFANAVEKAGYVFEKSARFTEIDKTVEQPKKGKKIVVESKRWVVERSFAWTNFYRRVVKEWTNEFTFLSSLLVRTGHSHGLQCSHTEPCYYPLVGM